MSYEISPSDWLSSVGPPFEHQITGVKFLLKNKVGLLADEMGSGKTRQLLDAACILWDSKEIDTLLVISPASVKTTWKSEIELHSWVPSYTEEYTPKIRIFRPPEISHHLHIIIANYEFVRMEKRLAFLLSHLRNRRTMLVFDEASYIKSHRAAQTKASSKVRQYAQRAYLCNGSPIANSLIDLYAPFAVLDKNIIGAPNYWAFRNRYCVMGGYQNKQIIGYRNVEHLQQRLKPYILRRLKDDCLDLPPKLYAVANVPLTEETWRIYKQLKDEMIAWLDEQTPIVTMNTIVKLVRLSQLTSGMIGGLNRATTLAQNLGFMSFEQMDNDEPQLVEPSDIRVISTEKHQYVMNWLGDMIKVEPTFRVIIWTRFRKEQEILQKMLEAADIPLLRIYGGQPKGEREHVIRLFNQPSERPIVLLGQPKAGGLGINLQAECAYAVYVSQDYSLLSRSQSEDRIHRSGQKRSVVNYLDLIATGPQGQKTVDWAIYRALKHKEDLAVKTTAFWRHALMEE